MESANNALISTSILSLLFPLLLLLPSSSSSTVPPPNQHSLVVAPFAMLQLSHGIPVKYLHSSKPGTSMVCERVHVYGFSRIKNLRKFAHSVMLSVSAKDSSVLPKAEVCFHRNISLEIGMCPNSRWEKISNGSWARSMSPFGYKVLDIRTTNLSLEGFVVSIEEAGFFLSRVIYLILGIILMSLAPNLSNSLAFYYVSTITTGAVLVILICFFQGLKKTTNLYPTHPKTSLLIYSSAVGYVSFLLYQFPQFWHSILMEIGIDEEIFYALVLFLLVLNFLAGAWLGFWAVRKCILTKDGSIDLSTSHFVEWFIRILSAVLILQSSVDTIVALEALVFGILISSLSRRIFRSRILRRIHRNLTKLAHRRHRKSRLSELSSSEDSLDKYNYNIRSSEDFNFQTGHRSKGYSIAPSSSDHGFSNNTSSQLYLSSFHTTPERRRFSKPDWEEFTKESTEKALEELVSSPGFGKWLSKSADRISVTPPSGRRPEQKGKWFQFS
ncbi:uncharacterized protein LOC115708659 isoform X1 [Cannabis sativa]|uniref:uncharacterized protein LOC115708659 isoform X1 n=1 Tax=Cannabis sativa TaxID=3483 RepID=UPI0029C9E6A2|nr:uncharacterized protein LOC115708659 isoform X1 [Cannabis sativa]